MVKTVSFAIPPAIAAPAVVMDPAVAAPEAAAPRVPPRNAADLVTAFDKDKTPWQFLKYSSGNSLWQCAGMRRRAHPRRTNTSLGVCSIDLSGPHEATPRPGNLTHKNPCHYYLVLTVRPVLTAGTSDASTQCEADPTTDAAADPGGGAPSFRPYSRGGAMGATAVGTIVHARGEFSHSGRAATP